MTESGAGSLDLGGDRRLYYRQMAGDPALPCLVFLHDGLGSCAQWKDFPDRLCGRTRCAGLLYDRQGFGRSGPAPHDRDIHYLHHSALTELPAVLAALLPGQPLILIGHSDGGSIALLHAAGRRPRLRGIVVEAAHVFVEPETLAGVSQAGAARARGELDALAAYHGERAGNVFSAWHDTWLSPWFRHWNIEYALPAIACPVLAIQGEDDPYGTQAQVDAITARCASARRCMLTGCGHAPHHQATRRTLDAMSTFVQALTPHTEPAD